MACDQVGAECRSPQHPGRQPGLPRLLPMVFSASGPADGSGQAGAPAELLDSLLNPLLEDFEASFRRGLTLLPCCPEQVLAAADQAELRRRLQRAQAELQAARALRAATPAPMALDMATIAPWHALVVEVWSLSAALRAAGALPPLTDAGAPASRADEPGRPG